MAEEKLYLSWDEVEKLSRQVGDQIKASGFIPDAIIDINRGGMVPARILSDHLGVKHVYSIGTEYYTGVDKTLKEPRILQGFDKDLEKRIAGLKVLLVDEVCQSGGTFSLAVKYLNSLKPLEVRTAVLHLKPQRDFKPDYHNGEITEWIVYPWETEESKQKG